MEIIRTDYLIVGSGIAGLAAAYWAAANGDVLVLCKDDPANCNSTLAQGGIAAAISKDDSPRSHFADTIYAGAGACRPEMVQILTEAAPQIIHDLLGLGVNFDYLQSGELALAREGAHSKPRILHHGDNTGEEIWQTIYRKVTAMPPVTFVPHTYACELVVKDKVCQGLVANSRGKAICYLAKAVVLATGGCGQIYTKTTNSLGITGDGIAIAQRAGAKVSDLEFVQFHPTAYNARRNPLFLISEAVRGEGAVLINESGQQFMRAYHPLADLAPRDVVSRAIFSEQRKGSTIYLDARSIGKKFGSRFPTIFNTLREDGINPAAKPIPVTPAAHFLMGGIITDSAGRTNIDGLYACGETACTGVHGANRLASNSLLEGMVFGQRVAQSIAHRSMADGQTVSLPESFNQVVALDQHDQRLQRLRNTMWKNVGIVRDHHTLSTAQTELAELETLITPQDLELNNMLHVAKLITAAALTRCESRGSHFRADYPAVCSA